MFLELNVRVIVNKFKHLWLYIHFNILNIGLFCWYVRCYSKSKVWLNEESELILSLNSVIQ